MAVSGLAGEDERKALDYLSTRLEIMVKELMFCLIMVSHINDAGQTRGSRLIAKNADIVIALQRDVTNPDPVIRCTTNIILEKNRFAGKTGPAGSIIFNPVTYTLSEDTGWAPVAANDNSLSTSRVA
jgi:twinkle protein